MLGLIIGRNVADKLLENLSVLGGDYEKWPIHSRKKKKKKKFRSSLKAQLLNYSLL